MAIYLAKKFHKELSGKNMKVMAVYNAYRAGGLEVNGKYVGRSFIYFPKRINAEIVLSGDPASKIVEGEEMELREKKWNKETRVFEFHKVKDKLDGEFWKTYKKVFDISVIVGEEAEMSTYDKLEKRNIANKFPGGTEVVLQEMPASRVRGLLESLDLDNGVQLVSGKDKAGNVAMVKPYDWEDEYKEKLVGVFFKYSVKGEGLDTKFIFKEGKEFNPEALANEVQDKAFDDAPEFAKPKVAVVEEEITIDSIPF